MRQVNMRFALFCGAFMVVSLAAQSVAPPELVLTNARIYTVDATKPWAEAVAITGSRITAVGSAREIAALAGPRTRTIDLKGAFVSPGFNDAHVHIDSTGGLLVGVNLLTVHEAKAFTEAVKGAASRLPPGSWITRGDWGAYEQWNAGSAGTAPAAAGVNASGPFTPSRDLVDAVTPHHPVFVQRFDRSMDPANSLHSSSPGSPRPHPIRPMARSSRMPMDGCRASSRDRLPTSSARYSAGAV